jgi:3alpha(or 20beta)-hydroxysteroid dehydrogenase
MGRLDGKVAIVTGAARGMGAAHARLFVSEGAEVLLADLLVEPGQAEAEALGSRAIFQKLDVRRPEEWDAAVQLAEADFGPISILVNNAAVMSWQNITQLDLDEYLRVIEINQQGIFLGMRSVVASMRRAGGGSIVNVASIAALAGTSAFAYCASKWAVRGMTKSAALTLAADGIRVNCVHPGVVRTPMIEGERTPAGRLLLEDLEAIPLGRVGDPADVSQLVLYLVSDESDFITGADHIIDGGESASVFVRS